MKRSLLHSLLFLPVISCSQYTSTSKKHIGGPCEGCEAIYESPTPFDQLNDTDTLPDFNEPGTRLEISGIIYQHDGKTPAANVVLYVYHTNQSGIYPAGPNESGWAKRHGTIRGWIKTGPTGYYRFYTLVPAAYPDRRNPKHIHPVIKEKGKNEYWIDEFLFNGDPLLDPATISKAPKGGSGLLYPIMKDGMLRAVRNITLGLNVEAYPGKPAIN